MNKCCGGWMKKQVKQTGRWHPETCLFVSVMNLPSDRSTPAKKSPGNYGCTRLICVAQKKAFHAEHSGLLSRTCVCPCVSALLVSHSGATVAQLTAALQGLIANYRLQQVMAKHTVAESMKKNIVSRVDDSWRDGQQHCCWVSQTGFHKWND